MSRHDPRSALASLLLAALATVHAPGVAASESGSSEAQAEREKVACDLEDKDLTRLISLRVDPDAGYVCDVLYEKPDEGDTREVLWSAKHTVDYCRPRYENLVQGLADRGWTCDYAEDQPGDAPEPELGAAQQTRTADDDETEQGARGQFRDWCVTDAVNAQDLEIEGPIRGYCDCVARGMDSRGLNEEDAKLIFDGLSSLTTGEDGQITEKRLNTLTTSYREVNEFCG